MCSQAQKKWVAEPLSCDQKPDNALEQKRILSKNGRIEPFRDLDGNPMGPARVWLKTENIPGLAMSRSFGDYVAQRVGVISEPEVKTRKLKPEDKFMVVASDGVWEFLSNDDVMKIIIPFYLKNDPEGACEKIIRESTEAWKREDEVVDDITIILVFFSVI